MREAFEREGFLTLAFPNDLRKAMLTHIISYIRDLVSLSTSSLEEAIQTIPDGIWQKKMSRCFRIFPQELAQRALKWAHNSLSAPFHKKQSAVNVVLPQEVEENPHITKEHLAIYWRCVRPKKPDAGRLHRDAGFWELEFREGYDPKVPFPFNYLKNCMKVWIPLYGCTSETTLRIIPRSHLMEIPTIVEQTEYGRRPAICPKWIQAHESLLTSPVELSQDSCIFFDMNLVHVGPCHQKPQVRISAEFNYISA